MRVFNLNTIEYTENILLYWRRWVSLCSHKCWNMLIQAAKSWLWGGNQAGLLLLAWFKSTVQHLWAAMVIENAYRQASQIPIYSQFDHFKSDSCMIGLVILPVCNHRILKKKIEDLENSLQASQKDAEVRSSNVAFRKDFDEFFFFPAQGQLRDMEATMRLEVEKAQSEVSQAARIR